MKKTFFIFLFAAVLTIFPCLKTSAENNNGIEISNNYFSFSIPDEMKGTYTVLKQNNGIFIYEKKSESDGFAFGIKIFKSPKEYANLNGHRKIGELKDRKNNLYDLVLIRPTEISYGEGEKIL